MQMHYPASELVIDPVLIRSYDVSGPRYTSYPTADRFVEAFGEAQLRQWLARRNIGGISQPLSVYVHLPFCDTVCYYCACNKVVTRDHSRSAKYIKYLEKELALLEPLLGERARASCELHWGGGTPTFLSRDEMAQLVRALDARFKRGAEDRVLDRGRPAQGGEPARMKFLAGLGFNRVSIGVQDFDPAVQRAVNRIQSEERHPRVIEEARANGFRSVNLDLIYGLPKQTLDSFNRTLDQVLDLNPDRIALYSYAHLPKLFMPQRRIAEADLPSPEAKLQIMTLAIGRLTRAGYLYIGMDHFARAERRARAGAGARAAPAQLPGLLDPPRRHRSGSACRRSARSGRPTTRTAKDLDGYYAALDAGRLPVMRGLELDPGRPRAPRGDPGADVPLPPVDRVDRALVPHRFPQVLRRRARRPAPARARRPGRARRRLDHGDAAGQAAGARDLHGVRPLSARARERAPPIRRSSDSAPRGDLPHERAIGDPEERASLDLGACCWASSDLARDGAGCPRGARVPGVPQHAALHRRVSASACTTPRRTSISSRAWWSASPRPAAGERAAGRAHARARGSCASSSASWCSSRKAGPKARRVPRRGRCLRRVPLEAHAQGGSELLPLAEQHLTAEDWRAIDRAFRRTRTRSPRSRSATSRGFSRASPPSRRRPVGLGEPWKRVVN